MKNLRTNSQSEDRRKEIEKAIKATALSNESSRMAKILTEMGDLYQTSSRGQVYENRYNHLKKKATTIFNQMDDEWKRGITGTSMETTIES